MKHGPKILLLGCLWLLALSALAKEERLPTTIEADQAEIDDRKGVSTYSGNVIVTQGKIRVEADLLTVTTREGELLRIQAEGEPVRFQQTRENEETIRGRSLELDYDAQTERVLLLKNAELWQDNNHFSGERIQYDLQQKRVLANGGEQQQGQQKKRVQVTIQPKQDAQGTKKP